MAQFQQIDWVSPPSKEPDQHGNYWYTIIIADKKIAYLAKNVPEVGQVYGTVSDETSKAGNPYKRFRKEKIPDDMEIPASAPKRETAPTDGLAVKVAQLEQRVALLEGVPKAESTPRKPIPREMEERVVAAANKDVVLDDIEEDVDLADIPF